LNILKNKAPLSKEEEIKFYDSVKKIFESRAVEGTYKVGDKISLKSIDGIVSLLKSNCLREARSLFSERERKARESEFERVSE